MSMACMYPFSDGKGSGCVANEDIVMKAERFGIGDAPLLYRVIYIPANCVFKCPYLVELYTWLQLQTTFRDKSNYII